MTSRNVLLVLIFTMVNVIYSNAEIIQIKIDSSIKQIGSNEFLKKSTKPNCSETDEYSTEVIHVNQLPIRIIRNTILKPFDSNDNQGELQKLLSENTTISNNTTNITNNTQNTTSLDPIKYHGLEDFLPENTNITTQNNTGINTNNDAPENKTILNPEISTDPQNTTELNQTISTNNTVANGSHNVTDLSLNTTINATDVPSVKNFAGNTTVINISSIPVNNRRNNSTIQSVINGATTITKNNICTLCILYIMIYVFAKQIINIIK